MTTIFFETRDNQLVLSKDMPVVASGCVNTVQATVAVCSNWEGYTLSLVFFDCKNNPYEKILDENNTCKVPCEVLTEEGRFKVGLRGVSGTEIKTSNRVAYRVRLGTEEGEEAAEPTPSIYQQIIAMLEEIKANGGSGSGEGGADGKDGIGIQSIELTSTEGLIDTYTITYTDNTTSTFQVKNGADGVNGKDGLNGKSAYQYAVSGGYVGSEEEFAELLANSGGDYIDDEKSSSISTYSSSKIEELINNIIGNSNTQIDEQILTFDSTNDIVKTYISSAYSLYPLDDTKTIVDDYVDLNADNDKPKKYTLSELLNGEIYFTDEVTGISFKDVVSNESYDVYNLIPKHSYRYVCMNEDSMQKIGRIKDISDIRMIHCDRPYNVRDIGGRYADGGTVNYGLIYRGARLLSSSGSIYLSDYDKDLFRNRLSIDCEIDMRKDDEVFDVNATTSPIGANVTYKRLPMNSGYTHGFSHTSDEILQAKTIIQTIMQNAVDGVVTYVHCSAGADRTGTVASILNGVLGVSQLDLDIDFELTSMTPYDDYFRPRYGVDGYGQYWKSWKDYINGLGGDNPYITWCKSVGIPIDLINSYRNVMIDGEPTVILPDSNALSTSVDVNGNLYNDGIGYMRDMRLNSSGEESTQSGKNCFVTGYMPFTIGQTIRFENMLVAGNSNVEGYDYIHRFAIYDENKTFIETKSSQSILSYPANIVEMNGDYITQVTLNTLSDSADMSLVRYIRISAVFDESGVPAIYIS